MQEGSLNTSIMANVATFWLWIHFVPKTSQVSEEDNPLLSPIADNLQKIPNNEDKFSPFSNFPNVRRKY